ncbi:MarR family transcriptional regulator [Cytobacillus sp. S13-E01]|uniref:MarR family transcriptional regulator n=1 Tax=Cytobacillus sp. S13-E01 TaxID=3031326 RepID=UPI0023D8141C|nr:MarR family transcriptional regulator [Cytobacillus sp. S13-E01]MDF0728456.1 MarR family transcriptional regulator [Cytobacillus sp. S13-E01]
MNDVSLHALINHWRGMYKALEHDWQTSAKDLGLTTAEQHMLWIIHFEKEVTMTRIAEVGLWDISTVVQVANRLKKKGYIQTLKHDNDRRISYCILTNEGDAIRAESAKYHYKTLDYLSTLNEDSNFIETLSSFQKKFNEHFHGRDFVEWIERTSKIQGPEDHDKKTSTTR